MVKANICLLSSFTKREAVTSDTGKEMRKMADVTYEVLAQFVRGVTGWDDGELERAIGMVQDAGAEVELFGDDARALAADGEERIQYLDPVRVAYWRILDSAGLRSEPFLVQGERGWRFQVDSDAACRLMAAVPAGRRSSAWHWLWEETTASWSELADELEAA